jgi:hypothetical protein
MKILIVKMDWIYQSGETKEALIAARKERFEKIGLFIPEGQGWDHPTVPVTHEQYIKLTMLGERGMTIEVENDVGGSSETMSEKMVALAEKLDRFSKSNANAQYNEKCEVYTPGAGLMLFNRVMLLQDACSDALQNELDNGWRIVAACPQPDQRRPDYIMGKYAPDYEGGAGNNAVRG